MSLGRRLEKLEIRAPLRRCGTCKDWPEVRVSYEPPGLAPRGEADTWPRLPDRCPACGWAPLHVVVEYAETAPL